MLPEIAQRTSSSEGEGFSASSAEPVSIMPGVQKPHCSPCSSLKAAWIAWSCPSWSSPSTVVTSRPSACTPNIVQDLIGRPSSSTVQAPQLVVSQPTCVPVSPNSSRIRCARSIRGSTSALRSAPLTLTVISIVPLSIA